MISIFYGCCSYLPKKKRMSSWITNMILLPYINVTIGQSKGWRVPGIHAPGADRVQPWSQRPPLGADLRGCQISPQAGWDLHPGQDAGVWPDEVCSSIWGH